MIENIFTLLVLILLQAVLGLDNLLYISFEAKNAPRDKQRFVRNTGIGLAIILRVGILALLVNVVKYLQKPIFSFDYNSVITGSFNTHSLIVYLGGGFIMYTAIKEIWHMISHDSTENKHDKKKSSVAKVVAMIVLMNIVFSFDSILSAIALTDVFWVMMTAIIIGGLLMIWLSEKVSVFLEKNKKYEVLGLFILLIVGVMLITEAAHISHLHLFGNEIHAMSKATFYFVLAVLVLVDIIQSRYQKKLTQKKTK